MNRTHHLKQTLIKNIEDNSDYDNWEIVLLDYNSQDGMEDWVKEKAAGYIASGKVIYYQTPDPDKFNHSHAKNVAFNLATGDIVCNINADNFTGLHFASYVNESFNKKSNQVLTPIYFTGQNKDKMPPRDIMGKVCVRKNDFLKVNGFDESMAMYGFEDYDFINRLELANINRAPIEDAFWGFIEHENEERYSGGKITDTILSLYIHYCSPSESLILLLFNDSKYEMRMLTDMYSEYSAGFTESFSVKGDRYVFSGYYNLSYGSWSYGNASGTIHLYSREAGEYGLNKKAGNDYSLLITEKEELKFYHITNTNIIMDISIFRNSFSNREIMKSNLLNKVIAVNPTGYGRACLFKNFDKSFRIEI